MENQTVTRKMDHAMRGAIAGAAGTASGPVYGLLRSGIEGVPAPLAGMLFGAALWAIGFEGWLPALGVMPATTDQAPKR